MATEKTIKKQAIKKLKSDGYCICVPTRQRFGSSTTYFGDDYKQSDDLFTIFDLTAWKKDKLLFVQYTSRHNVPARITKIKNFIQNNDLDIPCKVEVWGYEDRKGFTRIEDVKK